MAVSKQASRKAEVTVSNLSPSYRITGEGINFISMVLGPFTFMVRGTVNKTPLYFKGFKHRAPLTFALGGLFLQLSTYLHHLFALCYRISGLCGANGDCFINHTLLCKLESCKPHKLPTTTRLMELHPFISTYKSELRRCPYESHT